MEDRNQGTFGTVLRKKATVWYPKSLCEICTALASGVHYGVVACEGCKAFYRRSLTKKIYYQCYSGGHCTVGPHAKGRCRACRFQSCVKNGMRINSTKMGRIPLRRREVDKALSSLNSPTKPATATTDNFSATPTLSPATSPSKTSQKMISVSTIISHVRETQPDRATRTPKVRLAELVNNVRFTLPPLGRPSPTVKKSSMAEAQLLRRTSVISFVPKSAPVPLDNFLPLTKHNSCLDVDNSGFETPRWLADEGWRDIRKETTIKTVMDLIKEVHGQDYATWDAFMYGCIVEGKTPRQPQVSLKVCIDQIVHGASSVVEKHCKLSLGLPGYAQFSKTDQQTIVSENWMAAWLTTHHEYYRNNTAYYLIGPLQIHYCIYWLQQVLEPDYLRAVLACTAALSRLDLNRVEAFLLLAVAMFTPGLTDVENEAHMSFLHSHYTDCLISLLRSNRRGSAQAGPEFEAQVLGALGVIRRFNTITRGYVRTLDLTKAPFQPKEGSAPISIPQVMDYYGGSQL